MSKPVLYTFGLSVWSAVPELAIIELGYPEGAIDIRTVVLIEGANFTPEFLQLNPKATLPTLVAGSKVYTTTKDVTHYFVQHASKKVAPGSAFIDKLHEEKYDPNLPMLLVRNEDELKAAASGFPLVFVENRQKALEKHAQLPEAAAFKSFYEEKKALNGGVLAIYKGEVPEDAKLGFFAQSKAHWETIVAFIMKDLPATLPSSGFLGGAEPGEDDFHLGAWLARIANLRGGTVDKDGYKALELETRQPVPAKVASYWAAWSERQSWKTVYANGLH